MKREHLGTVGTKTTGQCVDECGDATRFTDHDATSLEALLTAKTLGLANLGDGLLSRASSGETPKRHHGVGPDDTIRGQALVGLEVAHRGLGIRPEDAVDIAGVEAEAAEPLLQIGDVVATGHGGAQVEHAIAKPEVGLDQCCPGVWSAFAVFHQAACGLKGPNGCHRVRIVDLGVARCRKTGSGESAVKVANRASLIARTQR